MIKFGKMALIMASVGLLAGCAYTCSGQFEEARTHLSETANTVLAERSLGHMTDAEAMIYQLEIEAAYNKTVEGNEQCEVDKDAAVALFKEADGILDGIDTEIE
jgi:hypothetical protein